MTSPEASRELARAVAAIRRLGRRLAATRAVSVVAVTVLLILASSRVLAGLPERSGSILPMLLAGLVLAGAALAGLAVGSTVRAFRPARKSDEVERARGLGPGEFQGALELGSVSSGSSELARLQQDRVANAVQGVGGPGLLPESRAELAAALRVTVPIIGLSLVAGTLAYHGDPETAGRTAAVLARPWTAAFPPPPPPIEVSPPGGQVSRGSSFAYRVVAADREHVYVHSRRTGRPVRQDTLDLRLGEVDAHLAPVDEEIHFWVTDAGGSVTDTFAVVPVDPVSIVDVGLSIRFPPYLDRPDEQWRGSVPLVRVPLGARLDFTVRANHPLLRLGMVREGETETDTVWFETDRDRAAGSLVARSSVRLSWLPVPLRDVPVARSATDIRLSVVADEPPELRLSAVAGSVLAADGRLPLLVEAADDHGLSSVVLEWWRETAAGRRETGRREPVIGDEGPRRVVLRPVLNLKAEDLLPGDEIAIFASASDRNPSTPPTVTDTLRVRVPGLRDSRVVSARETESLTAEIRSLSSRTSSLGETAREAGRRTHRETSSAPDTPGSSSPPDYTTTEESRDVLREAERVQEELARKSQRLETLREQAASSPWPDREFERQLGELTRLFEELRNSGLSDEIEALRRALERMDRGELREALSDLSGRSSDLSEELERALGLMERVALEQSLESARETAAELASRQRRDLEATTRDEAWAEGQESTAGEAEALADRLEALVERLEEEDAWRAARSGREAGERAREAAQNLRRGADAARSGGQREYSAQAGAQSLDGARDRLEAAAQQLAQDWGTDSRQVVERAASEALDLAEEQGQVAEALRQGASEEDLASRQAGLREGLDNLTRSLAEAGRKTALLDRRSGPAAARAGREMDALEGTLSGAGGRKTQAASQAESAANALSDLAGALIQSRRAMEGASSATGMEEALEMLSRLGRQQADLNETSGDLLLMLRGGEPTGDAMRGLAAGQSEVADGLEELSEDPASDGLAARPGELALEAEAIARQLESGILTPETVARQERLFRRLLDAGRSLEQDEEDPSRREARAAEPGIAFMPADGDAVRAGPRYPYPDDESMSGLDALQRRLVYDYFDRLNRESVEPVP